MSAWTCRAPGKVNLCLFVGEPRAADGLHPLVSVILPLDLADTLRLEPAPPGARADEVVCAGVAGPNLAGAALAAYRAATGWAAPPQRLTIEKRIPVAAGMGGGSADAAAALRLAAHAAGRAEDPAIRAIAPALGSDVPALLEGAATLVTDAGETVEPLDDDPPPLGLLILPSSEGLSTPAVYREADRLGLARRPDDLHGLAHAVRATAPALPADLLHNDLEAAARSLAPSIDAALAVVRAAGADHAMVSGSGPTVFGLFLGADGTTRAAAAATATPGAIAARPAAPGFGTPTGR